MTMKIQDFWDSVRRRLLKGRLLTTHTIRCEYARTHAEGDNLQNVFNECVLDARDFPLDDLRLSVDEFSRRQGWER